MSDLASAARFLQKMMTSDLNAIAECEWDRSLAYALEQACRQWASFWDLALRAENDQTRQHRRQRTRGEIGHIRIGIPIGIKQ
jgi:hypothetical protein